MKYQLVNLAVSDHKRKAVILLTDVHNKKSRFCFYDLDNLSKEPKVIADVNAIVKVFWADGDHWAYIKKEANNWKTPVFKIQMDDQLKEISSTQLDMEYFDHTGVLSPNEKFLALSAFQPDEEIDPSEPDETDEDSGVLVYESGAGTDPLVHIYDRATMKRVGQLQLENTFYANGLNFSEDSQMLGFISFDQGGGYITVGEFENGKFVGKAPFGDDQISDDYQMSGAVTFSGNQPIALTCFCGYKFEVVKYDTEQEPVWTCEFESAMECDGIDDEQYSDLVWNNSKTACVVGDTLYVGANSCVMSIDVNSGAQKSAIPIEGLFHIHRLKYVASMHSIFCVDVFGNCSLFKVPH